MYSRYDILVNPRRELLFPCFWYHYIKLSRFVNTLFKNIFQRDRKASVYAGLRDKKYFQTW